MNERRDEESLDPRRRDRLAEPAANRRNHDAFNMEHTFLEESAT
jgi:hypothetical protein